MISISAILFLLLITATFVIFVGTYGSNPPSRAEECSGNGNSTCISPHLNVLTISPLYKSDSSGKVSQEGSAKNVIQKDTPFILPFP